MALSPLPQEAVLILSGAERSQFASAHGSLCRTDAPAAIGE